jgi:outer membrane protein assembly factor BamB
MGVIELGVVTDGGEDAAGPADRPLRRTEVRGLLLAVAVALSLFGLTASALPVSHGPEQLWQVPFRQGTDAFTVTADAVYVLSPDDETVTAYAARTGEQLWSATGLRGASWVGGVESGVMLLPADNTTVQLEHSDGGEIFRQFTRQTVALDTVTGRQLWRQSGDLAVSTGGLVLLADWNEDGATARTLRVVRVRDGSPVWSLPAHDLETWTTASPLGTGADRLLTVSPRGEVTVYDLADGRKVSSGRITWHGQGREEETYTNLAVEGRILYLENVTAGQARVSALDTETLRELWHTDYRTYGGFMPCGPVLCLSSLQGTSGYDPATGRLRWTRAGAVNAFPLSGTLLLVDDQNAGRQALIEAGTGREVRNLSDSTLVWSGWRTDDTPYVLRSTEQPPGRTVVGELDGETGAVRVIGTMAPVSDGSCQSAAALLICVSPDQRLTVMGVG